MTASALQKPVLVWALLLTASLAGGAQAGEASEEGRWLDLLSHGDAAHSENLALVEREDEDYLSLEQGWLDRLRGEESKEDLDLTRMRYQTDIGQEFMQVRFFYNF
ncbi:hypothetical protein [Pseudomaricurvus sp. HS19]|uniref:hypothetical protein n=1 Tax=Pseudomaricurvus sp. HS19 TaxID=2692626 RepID=UPI00136C6DD7|nr:hypothetical protein [Pseudomaricurvus sp. HS19]MYM64966.1 hypothetical protein [Pseudomaricurvus sp. HS19]